MFCMHCGKEIPNDSTFCLSCGKVQTEANPVRSKPFIAQQSNANQNPARSNVQYTKPGNPFEQEYFFRMAHNNISLMHTSVIIESKNPFGKVLMRNDFDVSDLGSIELIKPNPFTVGALRFFVNQDGVQKKFTVAFEPWSKKKIDKLIAVLSSHTGIQPSTTKNQKQIVSKRALTVYITALLLFVFLLTPNGSNAPNETPNTSESLSESAMTGDLGNTSPIGDLTTNRQAENSKATQNNQSTIRNSSQDSTNKSNSASVTQGTKANNSNDSSSETASQKNAVKKAKSYISHSAFSREGLIAQLEFEKFSHEDAVYGAEHCGADWNAQALKKAKSYLEHSAFSYQGLIDQLEYEKYTSEQAKYAVDRCGANWNEQAAKKAKSYLKHSSFSREGLIAQLEYEKFTHEQAVYGVDSVGL